MSKLERAKQFFKETARPGLRVLSLAALAASAYAGTVSNSTDVVGVGTVYDVSGTFTDGDTLSGTVTIGSTSVQGANLTVASSGGTSLYNFTGAGSATGFHQFSNSGNYFYYSDEWFDSGADLTLDIYTGSSGDFSVYTGGALCSDNGEYCGGAVSAYQPPLPTQDPNLSSGSLAQVSTPEPSSALLLVAGGAVAEALRRRKRRA